MNWYGIVRFLRQSTNIGTVNEIKRIANRMQCKWKSANKHTSKTKSADRINMCECVLDSELRHFSMPTIHNPSTLLLTHSFTLFITWFINWTKHWLYCIFFCTTNLWTVHFLSLSFLQTHVQPFSLTLTNWFSSWTIKCVRWPTDHTTVDTFNFVLESAHFFATFIVVVALFFALNVRNHTFQAHILQR